MKKLLSALLFLILIVIPFGIFYTHSNQNCFNTNSNRYETDINNEQTTIAQKYEDSKENNFAEYKGTENNVSSVPESGLKPESKVFLVIVPQTEQNNQHENYSTNDENDENNVNEPIQPSVPAATNPPEESLPVIIDISALQNEMLDYINTERANANLHPLNLDNDLCEGANLKSNDMAANEYFSHISPAYGGSFDFMTSLGITYKKAAENIARNKDVKSAHIAFMNSAGHEANILNPEFNKLGLGFYQKGKIFM